MSNDLSAIALYGSYVCLDSSGVLRMCWPEYSTIWVKQRVAAPLKDIGSILLSVRTCVVLRTTIRTLRSLGLATTQEKQLLSLDWSKRSLGLKV